MFQFSIKKMMLWMTILAGGMAVVAGSHTRRLGWTGAEFFLCSCAIVVCGIWAHLRFPTAFDVMLPTVINILHLVSFLLLLSAGDYGLTILWSMCGFLVTVSYGIFLIVFNVRRIRRRDFSDIGFSSYCLILVYQFASWLFWTAIILHICGSLMGGGSPA